MITPQIPSEVFDTASRVGDVNLFIGQNGSGKSLVLGLLQAHYVNRGGKVIAVANSIFDKFKDQSRPNLFFLRDRSGRVKIKRSIKTALKAITPDTLNKLKNAAEVLRYVGFDPRIGLRRPSINERDLRVKLQHERISEDKWSDLISLSYKLSSIEDEIVWISMNDFSFSEINRSTILRLLEWEPLLKKHKIISEIEILLSKEGNEFPVFGASSGELSFISTLFFISTVIDERTTILIDEPENSLHPKWQKDYVQTLLNLFYLYEPKIFIATHSALIITGAEINNPETRIYKSKDFSFFRQQKEPLNIEEAFIDYFNVVTPQNRFLSDLIVDLLNKLAERKISKTDFENLLLKLQEEVYQTEQKNLLQAALEISNKIESING